MSPQAAAFGTNHHRPFSVLVPLPKSKREDMTTKMTCSAGEEYFSKRKKKEKKKKKIVTRIKREQMQGME